MSDSAGRPLVELDPNGKPTVLSYDVPEPTSYGGKNYIELSQLPQDAFITVTPQHESLLHFSSPAPSVREASPTRLLLHPSLLVRAASPEVRPFETVVADTLEASTNRLLELNLGQLEAMVNSGLRPVVFRGSGGLLDIRMVPVSGETSGDGIRTRHSSLGVGASGDGVAATEAEPKFLNLFVDSPLEGAQVSGPASGVSVTVAGTWEIEGARDRPDITLKVDGGADVVASVSGSGLKGTWQASVTVTNLGTIVSLRRESSPLCDEEADRHRHGTSECSTCEYAQWWRSFGAAFCHR